jgi:hypothetical protein
VGVCGLSLLCGPPVGIDVREVSSHLMEHWARHPLAVRVRREAGGGVGKGGGGQGGWAGVCVWAGTPIGSTGEEGWGEVVE